MEGTERKGKRQMQGKLGDPGIAADLALLGRNVREARERLGFSIGHLAALTHAKPSRLRLLEEGQQDITLRTLGRIAAALHVPAHTLFSDPLPSEKKAFQRLPAPGPDEAFAQNLRCQLEVSGYGIQATILARCGVSPSQLYRITHGTSSPLVSTVSRICREARMPVGEAITPPSNLLTERAPK